MFKLIQAALLLLALLPTQTPAATTVRYQHTDILGSVVAETDAAANIISRSHYEPFGKRSAGDKAGISYTGHLQDEDLNLIYMQQRYYDPVIGRFYSNDPVGFSADNPMMFNRYAYANNNPYKFVDPDGKFAFLAWFATPPGIAALEYTGIALVGILGGVAISETIDDAGTDESDYGCIYECDGQSEGQETESGNPYIGSADNLGKRAKNARDGRNRSDAKKVDKYKKGDRDDRRRKEQKHINRAGGKDKLDNKRDEIRKNKWKENKIEEPPKKPEPSNNRT